MQSTGQVKNQDAHLESPDCTLPTTAGKTRNCWACPTEVVTRGQVCSFHIAADRAVQPPLSPSIAPGRVCLAAALEPVLPRPDHAAECMRLTPEPLICATSHSTPASPALCLPLPPAPPLQNCHSATCQPASNRTKPHSLLCAGQSRVHAKGQHAKGQHAKPA